VTLISDLVGVANDLTQQFGLQANVIYHKFVSADGAGKRYYATGVNRTAVVTRRQRQVRTFSGELGVSTAQVVFIDPTPVSEFDKIVLPNAGTIDTSDDARDAAQPIIGTDGYVDATNSPVVTEIYLG
jgi:hypothetical protein